MNLPCCLACFFLKAWLLFRISCGVGSLRDERPGSLIGGRLDLDGTGGGGAAGLIDRAGLYP